MADDDAPEPQFTTLKERIAALNQQKNFNSSGSVGKPTPPAPARPSSKIAGTDPRRGPAPAPPTNGVSAGQVKSSPAVPQHPSKPKPVPPPLPRRDTQSSQTDCAQGERQTPPPLPSRTASTPNPPALPRRTTQQSLPNGRRGSASSEVSQRSTASSLSQTQTLSSATSHGSDGRRLAPVFDPASLPPLPPTRRETEAKEAASKEASRPRPTPPKLPGRPVSTANDRVAVTQPAQPAQPAQPSLPPRLPARPGSQQPSSSSNKTPSAGQDVAAKQTVPGLQKFKIQGFGSGKPSPKALTQSDERPPQALPSATRDDDDAPPPVPVASRPTASQIDASNARRVAQDGKQDEDCWVCRDWSGPDGVAAQFPRASLPRNDPVGHLAHGLCSPFPSYTDKARAIFTWFHHNIFYDTVSFFGNCVRHMSVDETIFSGKAVCQGYAETYKAIASRAGLECVVISGHGKGYGYSALKKGERPPPPKPDGHAWNAVRIDGGGWKLIDACWGAGHLDCGTNEYKQEFSPVQFTRTNEEFGESHFPKEPRYQFRADGRAISWDEYYIGRVHGETPVVYGNAHQEGVLERSIEPQERQIPVRGDRTVRFQFCKLCEHWRPETHGLGKPPLLLLSIHGPDGRKDEMVPMETNGYWHWLDVHSRDLGAPGQSVQVAQLTSVNGQDARGMSADEYLSKRGRVGMGWSYVMKWELV